MKDEVRWKKRALVQKNLFLHPSPFILHPKVKRSFTLMEILIAVSIFTVIVGLVGGIFATLSILLGGFFVFTWSISKQTGGGGKFQPGLPLLAFSAPDHNGNAFDSSTLDGRPVLLKFFRGHW